MDQNPMSAYPSSPYAPPQGQPGGAYAVDNVDPVAKSAMILGIIANIICFIPIGNLVAIVLGIIAIKKAGRGQANIEASGGTLRGKGCYIAGKVCGWIGIAMGVLMTLYFVGVAVAIMTVATRASHYRHLGY